MLKEPNYYARLGIPIDATPEEIRRAYRDAALRLHPDVSQAPGRTDLFIKVQEAYEVISDPSKRAAYDATLSPEVTNPPAITTTVLFSRNAIPILAEPQLIYGLLELKARRDTAETPGPPLNFCVVLDCSTSMSGVMMDTVKDTAIEILRQLRQQDLFSLVTFSDNAKLLVPASTHIERTKVETSIRMLRTGGGTEILKGLEMGYNSVLSNYRQDFINHVILITDGNTYGDEEGCLQISGQAKTRGIGISALGIGNKWNDTFLDKLTTRTGGSTTYVTKPREIHDYLREKFLNLGKSYADHVSLNLDLYPEVELEYAFRLEPETAMLESHYPMQLGPVPRNGALEILFEFQVGKIPSDQTSFILGYGLLTLDIPARTSPLYTMRLNFERPVSATQEEELPPLPIIQALSKVTLYRMQEQVQEQVASGKVKEAAHQLKFLATNLLTLGERELAQTVMNEAAHLQEHHEISESGKKRIKYGTRALLLPRSIPLSNELNHDETDKTSGNKGGDVN